MPWVTPRYSKTEVDDAGRVRIGTKDITDVVEYFEAIDTINNWRGCHTFPLNTFQATLRHKARKVFAQAVVAQRTKRLSSIGHKLERFGWLTLSEMQDIGGCRAILRTVAQVDELTKKYKESDLKHKLIDFDD